MENNLLTLKNELLTQKQVIESMSGIVSVAGNHPSPAEITQAIKTIPFNDLSVATATEADVLQGKTFFAGNSELKTGTAVMDPLTINAMLMYEVQKTMTDETLYYTIPEHVKDLRRYVFYQNQHKVKLSFHEDMTSIGDYSFYQVNNFDLENFGVMKNLQTIGMYAFYYFKGSGIDPMEISDTVTKIDNNAFTNAIHSRMDYKFPASLKQIGQAVFRSTTRLEAGMLDLSACTQIKTTNSYTFACLAFDCDFTVPDWFTTIGTNFNFNGCFKNIVVPVSTVTLQQGCFGGDSSQPVSSFYLNTVTFESEQPPTIGVSIFAPQHITNGFKIYVPDNAIEEYKATTNLVKYADCMYPMSQKE